MAKGEFSRRVKTWTPSHHISPFKLNAFQFLRHEGAALSSLGHSGNSLPIAGEKPHFSTRSSPKRPRASKVRDGESCLPKSWSRRKPPSRRAEPLSDLLFLLCPTACLRTRLGRRRSMPPLSFRHGWADVRFTEEGGREWLWPGGVRVCRHRENLRSCFA